MGSFDSLFDQRNVEWQTKAYDCLLDSYRLNSVMPTLGSNVTTYQLEVLGTGSINGFATVVDSKLLTLDTIRIPKLPLFSYWGMLIEENAL